MVILKLLIGRESNKEGIWKTLPLNLDAWERDTLKYTNIAFNLELPSCSLIFFWAKGHCLFLKHSTFCLCMSSCFCVWFPRVHRSSLWGITWLYPSPSTYLQSWPHVVLFCCPWVEQCEWDELQLGRSCVSRWLFSVTPDQILEPSCPRDWVWLKLTVQDVSDYPWEKLWKKNRRKKKPFSRRWRKTEQEMDASWGRDSVLITAKLGQIMLYLTGALQAACW